MIVFDFYVLIFISLFLISDFLFSLLFSFFHAFSCFVYIYNNRQKWIVDSRGAKAYLKYFKARQKLHQSTPYRYTYHLGLASMVTVDDNDVGRIVSQNASWHMLANRPNTPLHLIACDGKEVFCFSSKVLIYPGNVNACRVGLIVVVPEGYDVDG